MSYGYSSPPREGTPPINDPDRAWQMIRKDQTFTSVPATSRPYDPTNYTRIACISDTHGKHRGVNVPKCDVLIHAGDFSQTGEPKIIQDLNSYFGALLESKVVEKEIVCIAGNHDLTFHPETYKENYKMFHKVNGPYDTAECRGLLTNCRYLEDESYSQTTTASDGNDDKTIEYYGSPWQPEYGYDWAFNLPRNTIHAKWDQIPSTTEILITHGPPLGRNDLCKGNNRAGCLNLLNQVQDRVKPKVHIFGHIHEDPGVSFDGTTLFVNASSCNLYYNPDNPCIVFDVPNGDDGVVEVIKPECTLSGEEVLEFLKKEGTTRPVKYKMTKDEVGEEDYTLLIPFFEVMDPKVKGKDLIPTEEEFACSVQEWGYRLRMYRERNWGLLRTLLQDFITHLRIKSY